MYNNIIIGMYTILYYVYFQKVAVQADNKNTSIQVVRYIFCVYT